MIQCAKVKGNQQTNPPGYQGLASVLAQKIALALLIGPGCPPERIKGVTETLVLPRVNEPHAADLMLHLLPERLELKQKGDSTQSGSLWVDFLKPAFRRRYRQPH